MCLPVTSIRYLRDLRVRSLVFAFSSCRLEASQAKLRSDLIFAVAQQV